MYNEGGMTGDGGEAKVERRKAKRVARRERGGERKTHGSVKGSCVSKYRGHARECVSPIEGKECDARRLRKRRVRATIEYTVHCTLYSTTITRTQYYL